LERTPQARCPSICYCGLPASSTAGRCRRRTTLQRGLRRGGVVIVLNRNGLVQRRGATDRRQRQLKLRAHFTFGVSLAQPVMRDAARSRYSNGIPAASSTSGFIAPCIPTRAPKPPAGPAWVHEIKHDAYRLQVRREGDAVRLFMRRGYDWSGRYPAIAVTATLLRARLFTLDGEAVVCGPDGVAIFDALHRHRGRAVRLRFPGSP
jgi:ATP-dependent DNA ligase